VPVRLLAPLVRSSLWGTSLVDCPFPRDLSHRSVDLCDLNHSRTSKWDICMSFELILRPSHEV
jgi:hypothetical protein